MFFPGDLFRECEKLVDKKMLIGVYYDDPESVPEEELRFAVGVVVAQSESISIKGSWVRFLLDTGLFDSQFFDYFLSSMCN